MPITEEDKSISLVNLGKLAVPANILIEKISDAIGGVFKPKQIVRIAKAEAEANVIHTETELKITDLHRRALYRFAEEEADRQSNMESIISKALPDLLENTDPSNIDNDWIVNFFDKNRVVSDDEMQNLWSRILSGEANAPGTYSKKTITILSDIGNPDAKIFNSFCCFIWSVNNESIPVIFESDEGTERTDEIYKNNGINFNSLIQLEALGLIKFSSIGQFTYTSESGKDVTAFYHGKSLNLNLKLNEHLVTGQCILTKSGAELSQVCNMMPVDEFFEHVKEQWKTHLV